MICLLPLRWALGLGQILGWFWYYILPIRRGVAHANLKRAMPHLDTAQRRRITRDCMTNLSLSAVETLRAPLMTAELSIKLVERRGLEHYEAARASGKGVIAVMAHVGNIDMVGYSQAARGVPISAVVRPLSFGPAQRFVERVRQQTGFRLLPAKGSIRQIHAALKNNEVVALIIDQHMPKKRGIVCEFFGQLASTSPAPVRIAQQTGAVLLPVVLFRSEGDIGHHILEIGPAYELSQEYDDEDANVRFHTQALNRIVADWIERAPHQWLWLHRRWKVQDDPEGWDIPKDLLHLRDSTG